MTLFGGTKSVGVCIKMIITCSNVANNYIHVDSEYSLSENSLKYTWIFECNTYQIGCANSFLLSSIRDFSFDGKSFSKDAQDKMVESVG